MNRKTFTCGYCLAYYPRGEKCGCKEAQLDRANARIVALEGVVDCVRKRQEMLATGKVVIQMFPSSMYPSDRTFHMDGERGDVLVKKIRVVEQKMMKALAKLEEV